MAVQSDLFLRIQTRGSAFGACEWRVSGIRGLQRGDGVAGAPSQSPRSGRQSVNGDFGGRFAGQSDRTCVFP